MNPMLYKLLSRGLSCGSERNEQGPPCFGDIQTGCAASLALGIFDGIPFPVGLALIQPFRSMSQRAFGRI